MLLLLLLAWCAQGLRVIPGTTKPDDNHARALRLTKDIFPDSDLKWRVELGKRAQGLVPGTVLVPHSEEQDRTYGEFDLDGFGTILDAASQRLEGDEVDFCDLGSGLGRLVIFAAIRNPKWSVSGIEISKLLHEEAVERAKGYPATFECRDAILDPPDLSNVNFLFIYSTVFSCIYSPAYPYPILDDKWTQALKAALGERNAEDRRRRLIVTVDRALDPEAGCFDLVHTLPNIPNRETAGSVAYIHEYTAVE